jgi:hypothetical protein
MKRTFTTKRGLFRATSTVLSLILLIFLFSVSCKKFEEDFDFDKLVTPTWNPEFAFPLVNSTLYLEDFLEDSSNLSIVTNPDQSLSFIYSDDSIISATAGSFINFLDQSFEYPLSFDLPTLPPGFFDTVNFIETYTFKTEKETQRLDSIFLSEGFLSINGRTDLNRDKAKLRFTVLDIKNIASGEPIEIFANLDNPGGQNSWVYFDTVYDLSQYKMTLNDAQDSLVNTLTYFIDVVIEGDENPDQSPYTFELNGSLTDLEFDKAFGYFSNYELNFSDSLSIGVFEDVISGGVNIGQGSVNLSFDLRNSFGLPVTFITNDLYAYSDVNSPYRVDIELFGPGIPNEFSIASPDISQMGQSVESNLDFTQANFAAAFNLAPTKLYYDLSGITNYDGDTTSQNFILNDNRIVLDVDLEFELFGAIADFTIEDTVLLNFDQNPDEIDYMLFRLNADNGFPIRASAQIYFANSNYQVIDSLLSDDNKILSAAPVGGPPDYRVTGTNQEITDILIDKKRLKNIVAARYLLFRTTLSTTNQDLTKFYEDYNIALKLGCIAGLTVDNNN